MNELHELAKAARQLAHNTRPAGGRERSGVRRLLARAVTRARTVLARLTRRRGGWERV
jgi:hypothetical protein